MTRGRHEGLTNPSARQFSYCMAISCAFGAKLFSEIYWPQGLETQETELKDPQMPKYYRSRFKAEV